MTLLLGLSIPSLSTRFAHIFPIHPNRRMAKRAKKKRLPPRRVNGRFRKRKRCKRKRKRQTGRGLWGKTAAGVYDTLRFAADQAKNSSPNDLGRRTAMNRYGVPRAIENWIYNRPRR